MENSTIDPLQQKGFDPLFEDLILEDEFPVNQWEDWIKAVEATLKGASFDKVMHSPTYEGITLKPIYRKEDIRDLPHLDSIPGSSPYVRGNDPLRYLSEGWLIAQAQKHHDPERLNQILLDELNNGLTTVNLYVSDDCVNARSPVSPDRIAQGLNLCTLEEMEILLKGVRLEVVPIHINAGWSAILMLGLFNAYIKRQDLRLNDIRAFVGFDPISLLVGEGRWALDPEQIWQMMYQMTHWADMKAKGIRTILLDSVVYAESGANAVQQLAVILATAVAFFDRLREKGLSVDQIAPHVQLNIALGSNFYMEIAKVRAARLIWAELVKAYGGSDEACKIWIHGISTRFNKSIYDPYVNVLRTTTEAFSGVMGGIDSLEIEPFDALWNCENEHSKRIARNQQIILQEEAHLKRVVDPVGGCYYIESLTAELAEKAWKMMQKIESDGGIMASLLSGSIQSEIDDCATRRICNAELRKDIIVGVNMYANPDEVHTPKTDESQHHIWGRIIDRIDRIRKVVDKGLQSRLRDLQEHLDNQYIVDMITDAWLHHATIDQLGEIFGFGNNYPGEAIAPLVTRRLTEGFERLRLTVRNHQNARVYLMNMGSLSQYKARADFAQGFFAVAGFTSVASEGSEDIDQAVARALDSGCPAICICSTDDVYVECVPALCKVIKSRSSSSTIILAGYPQDMVEAYKEAGVDIFIHLRCNALRTLKEIAAAMEVEK